MIIYFVVLSVALLIYYLGQKKRIRIVSYVGLLIIILFAGFRYKVGIDFVSYWWIYENIQHSLAEPGYTFICKILSFANLGAQAQFLFFSAMTLLIVVKGIKFYNYKHTVFCLFLYIFAGFYVDSFNIIRQSVAIAIFFWSGQYIIKREFKKYIICIICASCFHLSALFLIPFYFILKKHYSKIYIITALVLSLILAYSGIMGRLIGYLPFYMSYLEPGNSFNINSNLGSGFFIKYIIGFVLLVAKDKIIKIKSDNNVVLNAYFMYLILMGILQDYLVFLRIAYFFQIFLIIALPALVSIMKQNGSRIITKGIIIVYGCLLLFIQTNDARSKLLPYSINFDIYQKEIEI